MHTLDKYFCNRRGKKDYYRDNLGNLGENWEKGAFCALKCFDWITYFFLPKIKKFKQNVREFEHSTRQKANDFTILSNIEVEIKF